MLRNSRIGSFSLIELLLMLGWIGTGVNIPIYYFFNPAFSYFLGLLSLFYLMMFFLSKRELLSAETITNIVLVVFFIHMVSLPVMNGIELLAVNWIVLYPIVLFSLKRAWWGLKSSLLFLSVLYILYFFSLLHESYTLWHLMTVGLMYVILSIMLFFVFRSLESKDRALTDINQNLSQRVSDAVNEIHEKEHMLLHQSRLAQMGEMLSMIAHQWRQPLSAITTVIATLKVKIMMKKVEPDYFDKKLDDINSYALHLSHTIEDFRNYFKPDKQMHRFQVKKIVSEALNLSESLFYDKGITVERHILSESVIESYESEIIQVILNLLKNAAEALEEMRVLHPKIVVELRDEKGYAILRVTDNAGGIPQEVAQRIFEPYFSTKAENGTGIGLYMSKTIIEEHCRGQLLFENRENGACFTVRLPLPV